MTTCKACLGKKQHSVFAHTVISWDFIGDKSYTYTNSEMRDCSRCNGTGEEPIIRKEYNRSIQMKEWYDKYLLERLLDQDIPKKPRNYTYLLLLILFIVLVFLLS
jgi:hypothetical protein